MILWEQIKIKKMKNLWMKCQQENMKCKMKTDQEEIKNL